MAVTTEQHEHEDHAAEGGHHDTPEERDRKERTAVWLFIGGDMVFVALMIFMWFYLRGLNTNDGWRFAGSSALKPWVDGTGVAHTMPVPKASVTWTIIVALATFLVGMLCWWAESVAKSKGSRQTVTSILGLTLVATLLAIGLQIYQFQILPFQTTWGSYASTFEFFMGSNLGHLILVFVIALGTWNRSRMGRYDKNWYQIRLARHFMVWVGVSAVILGIVAGAFA